MRVAICQTVTLAGDYEGNLARIETALEEAAAAGAELACFPEAALLGWVTPAAHERADSIPGPTADRLGRLADEYDLALSVGVAEADGAGDDLYNACLLFDADGDLRSKHRKLNLVSDLLDPPYTSGETVTTAETPHGTVGTLICADTFEADILDRMAACEPDLLVVPYGWAAVEDEWPEHGVELEETVVETARAVDAPVVGTDCVGRIAEGPWAGKVFGGQSLVAEPDGDVLVTLRDRARDVQVVDLTL